jgi:hypothetical protein
MFRSLALALALANCSQATTAPNSSSQIVPIQWGFNIVDLTMNATDTEILQFISEPIHTVYQMPGLTQLHQCDFSAATPVCQTNQSPCNVSLANDTDTAYFACSFHSSIGMQLTVNVTTRANETTTVSPVQSPVASPIPSVATTMAPVPSPVTTSPPPTFQPQSGYYGRRLQGGTIL